MVLEDEYYKVIDISEGKYNVMASSNGEGINWKNNNLDTPQMRWIMENLKELFKGVLL